MTGQMDVGFPMGKRTYSVDEVREILGISRRKAYELCNSEIVKRGKTYSLVYYEGDGKDSHQVWESGLRYSAAKSRKAQLEYKMAENTHVGRNNLTVSQFLYEFIEKYGEKKWVASTYDGNVGLLENYVHPYLGTQLIRNIRTKTVDDFYHFLLHNAEPAVSLNRVGRKKISASIIHDIHKVLRCAFNQAVKWEYIAKNPFLNTTLLDHHEKKRDALTPEQLWFCQENETPKIELKMVSVIA